MKMNQIAELVNTMTAETVGAVDISCQGETVALGRS